MITTSNKVSIILLIILFSLFSHNFYDHFFREISLDDREDDPFIKILWLCNDSYFELNNQENSRDITENRYKKPITLIEIQSDWEIDIDTKYENENISVNGSITISSGSSLDLFNVSLFVFGNITVTEISLLNLTNSQLYFLGNSLKQVKVELNSLFYINDSNIKPHEDSSKLKWVINAYDSKLNVYHSRMDKIGISNMLDEDKGIFLHNSTLEMLNTTIENSHTAFIVDSSSNVTIQNSSFINLNQVFIANMCTNITFGPNIIINQLNETALSLNNVSDFHLINSSIAQLNNDIISVYVNSSNNILICNSNISRGINVENSKQVIINDNRIIDPETTSVTEDYGICFSNVNDSILKNNLISGQEIGTAAIGGYGYGASILNGKNLTIHNNEIRTFKGWGLKIYEPIDVNVSGNLILKGNTQNYHPDEWQGIGGGLGIFISSSTGFEYIYNNSISQLPLGIYFDNRTNHEIYYLDTFIFLNNFENADDIIPSNLIPLMEHNWNYTASIWNSSIQHAGNYWKKYSSGQDLNNDSIIDTPYRLSLTINDSYPLYYPNYVPKISFELSHDFFVANRPEDQNITWNIDDSDAWVYNITENSTGIENGLLNDTRLLNTSISTIDGFYVYSCLITDYWNNKKRINLLIVVEPPDNEVPVLEGQNIALSEVTPKKTFVWNCTERYPSNYIVLLNKSINPDELTKGEWTNRNISFDLGNLFAGYYELNITLIDLIGNRYSNILDVSVIDNGAVIIGENERNASQDSYIDVIWDVYDNDTPIIFDIYRNGTKMPTDTTSIIITYYKNLYFQIGIRVRYHFLTNSSIIGLYTYNITIKINNTETNTSMTLVHIFDNISPTITSDPSNPNQIDELITENILFNWNCSDVNPSSYNMSIYSFENENSTKIYAQHDILNNNSWFGDNLTYELIPYTLKIGNYRFDVNVTDKGNNTSITTTLFSIIDNNTPILKSAPNNMILEYETIENVILEWNFTDTHPVRYQIWRNNTFIENKEWNGSLIKIKVVDYLWTSDTPFYIRLAYYELTIVVVDKGNNFNNDTTGIEVQDNIKPEILNPPQKETIVIHYSLNDLFNLTIKESLPNVYYLSFKGILQKSGEYNNNLIFYYHLFPVGKTMINLTLTDQSNNEETYIFELTLLDETKPILFNFQNNLTLDYPNTRLTLFWRVFDIRPANYSLILNEKLFISDSWIDRIYIPVNLDIGQNFLILRVYDTSNNMISDEFIITISDNNAPIIHYFDPTSHLVLYEGQEIIIRIIAEDEDPDKYYLLLDNELKVNGSWTYEIVLNLLEKMSIGTHIITVILFDGSGNSISHSIEIEFIETTTIDIPKVTRIFGMDQRSFTTLIATFLIIGIFSGFRRIKGRKRRSY